MNGTNRQANDVNQQAFEQLFRDACKKCFGYLPASSLSEADCKLMSAAIEDRTGLVIGTKSLRNYSIYVSGEGANKKENPSVATLDTLARYVLDAPYTTELDRKKNQSHHPYWFQYRQSLFGHLSANNARKHWIFRQIKVILTTLIIATVLFLFRFISKETEFEVLSDDFSAINESALSKNGWHVQSKDQYYWNKRSDSAGYLSLFTLKGDNWSDSFPIQNLLFRKISSECFVTTLDLSTFNPTENWQQAGLLLSEDSTFKGRVVRFSLSYNNFFGGFASSPEILLQGVISTGSNIGSKPEEFLHFPIFKIEPGQEQLVKNNLSQFALKVEKRGNEYRFLYAAGPMKDFAFKEAISATFNIQPIYIGIFAIQGLSPAENPIAARFDSFIFAGISCPRPSR